MAFQKTLLDQLPQRGFFFFVTLRSVCRRTIVLHPNANSSSSKTSLYHSFSSSQCNSGNPYICPPNTRYSWPFNYDFRDRRTGPIACTSWVSAMIPYTETSVLIILQLSRSYTNVKVHLGHMVRVCLDCHHHGYRLLYAFETLFYIQFTYFLLIAVAVAYSTIQDTSKVMIGFAFVQTVTSA